MHVDQASLMVKLVTDLLVQGGQGMEGDHRREVVFGMVVHVPHQGFNSLRVMTSSLPKARSALSVALILIGEYLPEVPISNVTVKTIIL